MLHAHAQKMKMNWTSYLGKAATTAVQLQRRDLLGGAVSLKFLTHVGKSEFSQFLKNELFYPLRNFPGKFEELTIQFQSVS